MRVPFAAVPVGNLRFEKPLPPEPWTNTYNATYFGPSCIQLIRMGSTTMESEDCLHLNIIAPQEKSPNGNPVLLWIHSGGYELGSANQYGYNGIAERWAPRGITVVTINYRLGALDCRGDPPP
uniref:Carboxylesterase type B domain-containing protein n=1 Tax=Acrobeloides nanus TaxID=290746 RepID=A0A914DS78_9BILA